MNSGSGYRFEADPNPTLHFDDDPDSDPTQSFTHIGKSEKNLTYFTAVPVCIVLSFP
jgi:hypothetical protein